MKVIFCLIILLISIGVNAQNFPVSASLFMQGSIGPRLNKFTQSESNNLQLIIVLNDLSVQSLDVKLEFEITGPGFHLQSNPYASVAQYTLYAGSPLLIQGEELTDYFYPGAWHYNGNMSPLSYSSLLLEGNYTICVRVKDATHPNTPTISNPSCTNSYYTYSNPPYLNFPICGSTIEETAIQSIFFQWTPYISFSQDASSILYQFKIYEKIPASIDNNQLTQSALPLFSTTTSEPFYNYSSFDPLLIEGKEYVWQVRVVDNNQSIVFRNNGLSTPCSFRYGHEINPTQFSTLQLEAQSAHYAQARARWNAIVSSSFYEINYRKQNTQNWFPLTTTSNELMIYNLEPNTSYEAKVRFKSGQNFSEWSNTVNFTTLNFVSSNCNAVDQFQMPGQFEPLQFLLPGMQIQSGQFTVEILESYPLMQSGRFRGKGMLKVFSAIPLAVEFDNIYIDKSLVVRQGEIRAVSNGLDNWMNDVTTGTILDGGVDPETSLGFDVDSIYVTNGTIHIIGSNGEETTIAFDDEAGNTFEDSDGDLYVVTVDGEVLNVGQNSAGSGVLSESQNVIWPSIAEGHFYETETQLYGYDHFEKSEWQNYYKDVLNAESGQKIKVDWKSVRAQKYDQLYFNITNNTSGFSEDSLLFVTGTGVIYYPQKINSKYKITLVGGSDGDGQELFAAVKTAGGVKFIAKVNAVNYSLQEKTVVLLNCGNASLNTESLETQLNVIYKQSVSKWNIELRNDFTLPTNWDLNNDSKLEVNSDLLSRYSDEMKVINSHLKQQTFYNKDDFYLIIPNQTVSNENVVAEMPRGKNIGYLFQPSTADGKELGHELGHGAFGLEHVFSGNTPVVKGSTSNNLDYAAGEFLVKFQWDLIHDPAALRGLFDADQDQMIYLEKGTSGTTDLRNKPKNFVTQSGQYITIPEIAFGLFNLNGALIWFKLTNGKKYSAVFVTDNNYFYGYVEEESASLLEGVLTDSKKKLIAEKQYPNYIYPAEGSTIFCKAARRYDNLIADCLCEYTFISDYESQAVEGAAKGKLLPNENGRANCVGSQCDDPEALGVKTGDGKMIFVRLRPSLPSGASVEDLVELCNYISDTVKTKEWCLYGYGMENISNHTEENALYIKFFKEKTIYSLAEFKSFFPLVTYASDYPIIFSTKDLWDGIPADYNRFTPDHILKNKGVVKNYEYTFYDLVSREKLKPINWFSVITSAEANGKIQPLGQAEYYQQYVAKFGTNSAFPYIASCAAAWSKDLIMAYIGGLAAPMIGGVVLPYVSTFLAEGIVSLGVSAANVIAALPAIISEYGVGVIALYFTEKFIVDAFIGASVDFIIQAAVNHYFLLAENNTWSQAIAAVDYVQVGASALENGLSSPFNGTKAALVSMGVNCVYDGFTEEGQLRSDFDVQDCGRGALVALISNKVSHFTFKALKQIPFSRFYAGMKKLANFSDEKIDEIALWLGVKKGVGEELASNFTLLTGITCQLDFDNLILDQVRGWQGSLTYPGIDDWVIVKIPAGTEIIGGLPGQSEFYSTLSELVNANYKREDFWKRLQVKPHETFGYRQKVGKYKLNVDRKVAISKTSANPQYGEGNGWQIFLTDFVNDLTFISEIQLQ